MLEVDSALAKFALKLLVETKSYFTFVLENFVVDTILINTYTTLF